MVPSYSAPAICWRLPGGQIDREEYATHEKNHTTHRNVYMHVWTFGLRDWLLRCADRVQVGVPQPPGKNGSE